MDMKQIHSMVSVIASLSYIYEHQSAKQGHAKSIAYVFQIHNIKGYSSNAAIASLSATQALFQRVILW